MTSSMHGSLTYLEKQELVALLEERARRDHLALVRANLGEWCVHALEPMGFRPERHHLRLIERLEAVERGEVRRLMVLMPPGSAKSTYASTLFPAWYMARNPSHAVIAASHTAELAERFGRRVRNMIIEHGETLGVALSPDNQAAGRWETTQQGEYFAAGVLGAITGRRGDLVIIDDPVKSRVEADSDVVSDRVWEWWKADMSTRLKPNAKVVLIMTRWSENDLGGRLLDDMASGGDTWEVLRLPMEAEHNDPLGRMVGEPLWPEWFTDDMRRTAKRDSRTWSALYQQAPAPESGSYFLKDWLHPVTSMPPRESLRIYGGSDYAVTSDGGDYTVHAVVGMDSDGKLWLLDLWRGQASSDVWVDAFCDLVRAWKPIGWAEEQGQIRAGIGPFLTRAMRDKQAYVARHDFPTRGDKAVRAQSIRGRMAVDGLRIPAAAAWRTDFESELMSFPVGKHDDQVDALGLVGQLLDRMIIPAKPEAPIVARGIDRMTLGEAFKLANPRARVGGKVRI